MTGRPGGSAETPARRPPPRGADGGLAQAAALGAGYLVCWLLLEAIAHQIGGNHMAAPWWPAVALGVPLVVWGGPRNLVAVAAALLIGALWLWDLSAPLEVRLGAAAAAGGAYGFAAARVWSELAGRPAPETSGEIGRLMFWVFGAAVVAGTAASALLVMFGGAPAPASDTAFRFAIIDFSAVLVVTAFALDFALPWARAGAVRVFGAAAADRLLPPAGPPQPVSQLDRLNLLAGMAVSAAVVWAVYGPPRLADYHGFYLCLLPLIWVTMRHGLAGAAAVLPVLVGGSLVLARESIIDLLFFAAALGVTGLILGATVSARARTDREARTQARRFQDVVHAASDWFWEADSDLRFSYVSKRARRMLDVDPAALIGERIEALGHDVDRATEPDKWTALRRDLESRRPFHNVVFRARLGRGPVTYLKLSGVPIFDEAGDFQGYRGAATDVTAEVDTHARLAQIIESTPDSFALFGPDERLLVCNRACREHFPPDAPPEVGTHIETLTRRRVAWEAEPDGTTPEDDIVQRYLDCFRNPGRVIEIPLSRGRWVQLRSYRAGAHGTAMVCTDITRLKQREAELAELAHRNALLATAVESSTAGMVVTDPNQPDNPIIAINDAFTRITGYAEDEVLGLNARFLHGPDTEQSALDEVRRAIATRTQTNVEMLNYRKDGSKFWTELRISPVFDDRGGLTHFVGLITDITERKEAARALQASQARLSGILEIAPEAIISVDERQIIRMFNQGAENIFGYAAAEILGKPLDILIPPAARPYHDRYMADFAKGSESARYIGERREITGLRRNGEEFPAEASISQLETYGERLFTVVLRDITRRKQAEDALRRSQTQLAHAQRMAEIGSWEWDTASNDWLCSDELSRILGLENGRAPRSFAAFLQHVPPEERAELEAAVEACVKRGRAFNLEHCIVRPDGTVRTVQEQAEASRDARGHITTIFATVQDVTERKRAEVEREQLERHIRETQKMEALGRLAGGIAHDFNNLLFSIGGLTELALDHVPPRNPARGKLRKALQAAEAARELVQQILTFSRLGEPEQTTVDPARIVDRALKLLRATLPKTIAIERHIHARGAKVAANAEQLQQVIVNLVTNAAQAIGEGRGKVTIILETARIDRKLVAVGRTLPPGTYAKLTVRDNGPGIPEGVLDRVFEPFFTTRTVGEGSGMGLAVVHGIVKAHRGGITVDSEPGQGTAFHVYLPLLDDSDGTDGT